MDNFIDIFFTAYIIEDMNSMKRIIVMVPKTVHKKIKKSADIKGLSMSAYSNLVLAGDISIPKNEEEKNGDRWEVYPDVCQKCGHELRDGKCPNSECDYFNQ